MASKFLIIVLLDFVIYVTCKRTTVELEGYSAEPGNGIYIGNDSYIGKIKEVTESRNTVSLYLDVRKKWPQDTILSVRVSKTNKDGKKEFVNVYNVSIFNKRDPLYYCLPPYLRSLTADGCIETGKYFFNDAGEFDLCCAEPKNCICPGIFTSEYIFYSASTNCEIGKATVYTSVV